MTEQAKMCHALSLASREEEPRARTVSETIEHIWSLLKPTPHERFRVVPHALVNHCDAPMNVITHEEVLPLFINHLMISGKETLFACQESISVIQVSKEVAKITESHLPPNSRYHYNRDYYQEMRNILEMRAKTNAKRIHLSSEVEECKEQEAKKSREEGDGQQRPNTPTGEDESDRPMTIEEIEADLRRYEGDDEDDQVFGARMAKNLAILGAFEQEIIPGVSLDEQVRALISKQKAYKVEAEVMRAVDKVNRQLHALSSEEYNDHVPLELIQPSCPPHYMAEPSIKLPIDQYTTNLECPDKRELFNQAIKALTEHKDDALDYQNLGKLITSFPSAPITLTSEIHEKRGKNNHLPKGTQEFFNKNLVKLLFNQTVTDQTTQLEESYVVMEDNSFQELEEFCTFRETESFKLENERLKEGPSVLTFSQNLIPEILLEWKKGVIIGATPIYRQLYISKQRYQGSEFLNLSPPFFLSYNEKLDESNKLFMYLREVVGQMGNQSQKLPILIEFYSPQYGWAPSFEAFIQECINFMKTLSEIQKGYAGKLICIGPPPYFTRGTTLEAYRIGKKATRKVAEALSVLGYIHDIFVTNPIIASIPTYHSTYPGVVGYICTGDFRPHPLFNKEGEPTSEACARAFKGIKADLRRMRRYQMI